MTPDELNKNIRNTVSDTMGDLLYYARKEDSTLPVGAIEKAILAGTISIDDIVTIVRKELSKSVASEIQEAS